MENTAHLLNEIDKKLMILLRDGRTLIGYLRSVDQFANLVLHKTVGELLGRSSWISSWITQSHRTNSRCRQVRWHGPRNLHHPRRERRVAGGNREPKFSQVSTGFSNFPFPFQDREKEEQLNSKLTQVSVEEILDAQRREIEMKQEKSALLRSRLKSRGNYTTNPLLEENEWIFHLNSLYFRNLIIPKNSF
jgi:U6 snRNA-associated Sm-like protein LSm1